MRSPGAALTPLIAFALLPAGARADVGGSIFTAIFGRVSEADLLPSD